MSAAGASFERGQVVKRALDIVLGLVALVLTAPITAACALAIRLTSPGPVFFVQTRVGRAGRPFAMVKLRTMQCDADDILDRHLKASASAREEWQRFRRLKHDPRVLGGLGALLRRSSLDELPQLWNVVRGDMSLVGPRPLEPLVIERFAPEARECRECVRPGITGLWQVSGRSELDIESLVAIDTRYVEQWTLWSDVRILFLTPAAVVSRRGAY